MTQDDHPTTKASALILAGGSGNRARQNKEATAKQFMMLAGKPLLAWSLQALSSHPGIDTLVLVLPQGHSQDNWADFVDPSCTMHIAEGGQTRRESTLNGLQVLADMDRAGTGQTVLIHDGARPFATSNLVDRLLRTARAGSTGTTGSTSNGAVPTLPVTDTLKTMKTLPTDDGGELVAGPDRNALVMVQTPQAFDGGQLLAAHKAVDTQKPDVEFTDDASIMEWAGHTCSAVDGDINNIKITRPGDWARAEAILSMNSNLEPRTGFGYDTHRLEPGEGVWLCGHFIAHTHKLSGHSDADVGLHALTDALLGAISAGDIGTHFPPSDPQWKGAESHIFLAHAAKLIGDRGGKIINVDVAIVAEQPKIGPHRDAMTARMAQILGIAPSRVSVKATTNERMGFAGREEGIAAFATASVMVPADD
jgi:2-C-methyl-D-erythritol 4-phosphate cytidylyltransferase/2-C-methyl-D-erythritol 2,4-cyclodiphosphate synthase